MYGYDPNCSSAIPAKMRWLSNPPKLPGRFARVLWSFVLGVTILSAQVSESVRAEVPYRAGPGWVEPSQAGIVDRGLRSGPEFTQASGPYPVTSQRVLSRRDSTDYASRESLTQREPDRAFAVASDLSQFEQREYQRNDREPDFEDIGKPIARTRDDARDESWLAPECVDCTEWTLLPQGLIYHSYLAGAKEPRFASVWHHEKNDGLIWDSTLGGRVGLLRYGSPNGQRPTGWQLDIEGAGLQRLDWDTGNELVSADFRFGAPLTYGNELHQIKLAYYHLSSHVGDEFLIRNPGFMRINYSRDVLVYGHSYTPTDNLRFYAEAGWAFYSDVGEPWEFQFGIDYRPLGCTGLRGAPFAAFNGHLRQELDFGGNFVVQAGWAWRDGPQTGLFRVGVEYYNGKDNQFSFINEFQSKVGLGIWYDY